MKLNKLPFILILLVLLLIGSACDNTNNQTSNELPVVENDYRNYCVDFYRVDTFELPFAAEIIHGSILAVHFKTQLNLNEMIDVIRETPTHTAFLVSRSLQTKIVIRSNVAPQAYYTIHLPNANSDGIFILSSPFMHIEGITFFFPTQVIYGENISPTSKIELVETFADFEDIVLIYQSTATQIVNIDTSKKIITIKGYKDFFNNEIPELIDVQIHYIATDAQSQIVFK